MNENHALPHSAEMPELTRLLSREIEGWRARMEELDRDIALKATERDQILAKIEAAETLLGKKPKMGAAPTSQPPIRQAISDLMQDGVRRSPSEMREALIAQGFEPKRVSTATGNFYTSLRRLLDDNTLEKDEDGRYHVPLHQ